ncbi:IPT/TIG domain-containing protein, partial [Chloroflexota bacterium]
KIDDKIAWYENRGGQFALATTDTAPTNLFQGQTDDLLKITATHRGRTGDVNIELATFDLLFEETAADSLTTAEANAIIENLHVYLDDGSDAFESGSDTLVTTIAALSLTAGRQTATFTDGDANVQVVYGTPRTYFVVAELTTTAASQTPNQFRITHVTESSSTAEDRDYDIPLIMEYVVNVASSVMTAFCPVPTIASVNPMSAYPQNTVSVIITGTEFTGATTVNFGTGITTDSFTIDNATQITANITVLNLAASGTRNVSVTTAGGTATLPGGFTVLPVPTIASVNPMSAYPQNTVSVIITGTEFTGATTVNFGTGITTDSFTIDNATQITANITVLNLAASGTRNVSVTTAGGTATLPGGFTVLEAINYVQPQPEYSLQMNLLGDTQSAPSSFYGRLEQMLEATFADGTIVVTIQNSTMVTQENGRRLLTFKVTENVNPPLPPENKSIIGLTYNFEPDGATFDPPIILTFIYDPENVPEGVEEGDLVLAFYDETTGEWLGCECICDPGSNCITASVYHFTDFAIIAPVPLPSPQPVPAELSLSNLTVEPTETEPGQMVTITMSIANTGGTQGSYTVSLKINDIIEDEKRVTVSAGGSKLVSFSISRQEAGSYSVTVDGLDSGFTVKAPKPSLPPAPPVDSTPTVEEGGINWYIIGLVLGVVILLAILIPIWIGRRRTA